MLLVIFVTTGTLHQSPEMGSLDNETSFTTENVRERKISVATSEYSYVHEHYWESMEEYLLQANSKECQLCQTTLFQYKEVKLPFKKHF